jgi:D-citramalate synthase
MPDPSDHPDHSDRSAATRPERVAIMDTTLRDGEQTPQLAFAPDEKLEIARVLLEQVGVDRIEIASAGVSAGEREAVRQVVAWARRANMLERVEVLGFCDGERSLRWLAELGGRCMTLLTKGSEAHCRQQLGKTPAEHVHDVSSTLHAAERHGVTITAAYLEDFSRGFPASPQYVLQLTKALLAGGVQRVYLPDTLGCLAPDEVERYVRAMCSAFPRACFEFHAHDDYGLATANTLAGVRAGARGVHTSVNGLGERAGNACLSEVVVALHDHARVRTAVDEHALVHVARLVAARSGVAVPANAPIVGRDAFTQTAGIHADGDRKAGLYAGRLDPQRFGRRRGYALGKLAGHASLAQNLDQLGIELAPEQRQRLLEHVVALGDRKQAVHACDLPQLIADVLGGDGLRS